MKGRIATPYVAGPGGSKPTQAEPEGGKAPVADCIMTDFGSVEPSIAITGDGAIYLDEIYTLGFRSGRFGSPYPYRFKDQGKLRVVISRDEGDS